MTDFDFDDDEIEFEYESEDDEGDDLVRGLGDANGEASIQSDNMFYEAEDVLRAKNPQLASELFLQVIRMELAKLNLTPEQVFIRHDNSPNTSTTPKTVNNKNNDATTITASVSPPAPAVWPSSIPLRVGSGTEPYTSSAPSASASAPSSASSSSSSSSNKASSYGVVTLLPAAADSCEISWPRLFKSYQHLAIIQAKQRNYKQLSQSHMILLSMMNKVARNDVAESIDALLDIIHTDTNNNTNTNITNNGNINNDNSSNDNIHNDTINNDNITLADMDDRSNADTLHSPDRLTSLDSHCHSSLHNAKHPTATIGPPPNEVENFYTATLTALKNNNHVKLWYSTSLKQGRLYLTHGNTQRLYRVVSSLKSHLPPDDTADCFPHSPVTAVYNGSTDAADADTTNSSNATTSLAGPFREVDNNIRLEVYAMEVQLYAMTRNSTKMKPIIQKLRRLANASGVADPLNSATISEFSGKMHMEEGKWDSAYTQLLEAFKNYQEAGMLRTAKMMLKYVVLSNMLSRSTINPFESCEVKAYQNDPDIAAMRQLRSAYDRKDVPLIVELLTDTTKYKLNEDLCFKQHIDDLLRDVRLHLLKDVVRPYETVRLSHLADELRLPSTDEVVPLLLNLSLDGELNMQIDEVQKIVKIVQSSAKEEISVFETFERLIDVVHVLANSIEKNTSSYLTARDQ